MKRAKKRTRAFARYQHNAFESYLRQWFSENSHRFALPVRLRPQRHGRFMTIELAGVTSLIEALARPNRISAWVEVDGQPFDTLLDLEAFPAKTPPGYICDLCEHEGGVGYFPTLEALWLDHLLEPFVAWVNNRLTQSRWLRLIDVGDGGITEASLTNRNELSEDSDPFMQLIGGLTKLDGTPTYCRDEDEITIRMVPLFEKNGMQGAQPKAFPTAESSSF